MKIYEVIDAIEKNGYEQIRFQYIKRRWKIGRISFGKPKACAIGQAALNLHMNPVKLGNRLKGVSLYKGVTPNSLSLFDRIVSLNDFSQLTPTQIAADLRASFKDRLNEEIL